MGGCDSDNKGEGDGWGLVCIVGANGNMCSRAACRSGSWKQRYEFGLNDMTLGLAQVTPDGSVSHHSPTESGKPNELWRNTHAPMFCSCPRQISRIKINHAVTIL